MQEIWILDSTIDMLNTIHKDYMYTGYLLFIVLKKILHGCPKVGVAILMYRPGSHIGGYLRNFYTNDMFTQVDQKSFLSAQ